MSAKDDFEARKQRALRRLQTDNPICRTCGFSDWRCLELHHIAGRRFHRDLVIVCRNCHRILSDAQCDHPPPGDRDSMIGRHLIGQADFFELMAKRNREFGLFLIAAHEGNPPKTGENP